MQRTSIVEPCSLYAPCLLESKDIYIDIWYIFSLLFMYAFSSKLAPSFFILIYNLSSLSGVTFNVELFLMSVSERCLEK